MLCSGMYFTSFSLPDSAASSTEGSSSSSAPSSFKGTKKKKQVPGSGGGDNVAAAAQSDNAANVAASKPKATQSKKSKGCQTSGGLFPYKAPPAAAATVVGGIQKNVKVGSQLFSRRLLVKCKIFCLR